MNCTQIGILLAACICFTGCYEIMEGVLEGANSYLDAQIAAQRRQIAAERERRKRALEDLEIAMKILQIKLELDEARFQARRVAAIEKLVDSMVYVNEARKYHHPDC